MPKIATAHYRKLIRAFEEKGFVFDRQEGDHLIYVKNDIRRPVVIQILNNLKTAGISRQEYLSLL